MPHNPHADFTPTLAGYSGITPFRFWCQTALPLTYDDSLSYYELLNKVVNYLNNTITDLTNVENNTSELADAYVQLQNYVNDYFDDIDIEAELRNVLDGMAEDGTLDALLNPLVENQLPGVVDEKIDGVVAEQIDSAVAGQIDECVADQLPALVDAGIPEEVSGWLTENVDPVGSAVMVDSSLTISGAAADAKVTGDEVSDLKTQIGETSMGTAATTVTGAIAEHEGDITAINSGKMSLPSANDYGTSGQYPRSTGNGIEWTDYGLPSDAQTAQAVSDWLNEHPEATTTVQDHSLTYEKLVNGTLGFVTPEMYGAKGDGITDDTGAFEDLIEAQPTGKIILLENEYLIASTFIFPEKSIICGKGKLLNNLETAVYIGLIGNSAISDVSFDGVGVDLCGTNVRADNLYIANSKDMGINVRADVTLPAQNIEVLNVRVVNPKSHGFAIQNNSDISSESRANAIIDNILFENCSFINNYNASFNGSWQVGFGVMCTGSNVKNVVFRDCYASGASESGFHCEAAVSIKNMVYDHCVSINNGQKADAEYGAGFLVPDPENAKVSYYHCFTKGNKRTLRADKVFDGYGELDITDVDTGFCVKNMVISGNGSVLMHGDRIKAYSCRQYTNISTAAIYRPYYFMSPAHCYTFKNGVYEMIENAEGAYLWCSPIFPINPAKQIKVDAVLKQNVAVSSSIRFYVIFFDGNMNNLGNKYITVSGMSDDTEYSFSNTFSNTYTNAVYAMIEINPRQTANTSLTTVKDIIVTEV